MQVLSSLGMFPSVYSFHYSMGPHFFLNLSYTLSLELLTLFSISLILSFSVFISLFFIVEEFTLI